MNKTSYMEFHRTIYHIVDIFDTEIVLGHLPSLYMLQFLAWI